jgi:putative phage-type endonuclease
MSDDVQLVRYDSRDAWLAARTASIGASESAALFGLSPQNRESPYSLWAKKAGLIEPDQIDSEWLEWGQILEEPIAQRYAARSGHVLWQPPTPWCVVVHPRLPFLTATLDRWIIDGHGKDSRGDLEIKNVGSFNTDWKDGIPLHIQAQVQHQLACTGFNWAVVAALIGGNKMETIEIERNQEYIDALEAKAEEFWTLVLRGEAPATDGTDATTKAIKKLHPNDNGETVDLPSEAELFANQVEHLKEKAKETDGYIKEFENKLRAMIGPNTFGALPDGRIVSLKTTARKGYTAVIEPTTYRTLRITDSKKKGSK